MGKKGAEAIEAKTLRSKGEKGVSDVGGGAVNGKVSTKPDPQTKIARELHQNDLEGSV